jgi:hypothetical protein
VDAPDPELPRRELLRVAAPLVLATVMSRTVWAQTRPPAGKVLLADASAGGSVVPSGTTTVKSLF